MNTFKTLLASVIAATTCASVAFAQDAAFQLPQECTTVAAPGAMGHGAMDHGAMDHGAMGHGTMDHGAMGHGAPSAGMMGMGDAGLESMPEHVQDNMRRMMISMPAMRDGMMHENADVAFACAMIAHHQGAIDMAQVLIAHGEDPQMLALADAIIAAQLVEMDEMRDWLAENAK